MRILLVEDDPLLGKGTRLGLEQDGLTVDWVQDGQTAETAALTHDYAAVLLDLGLPGQDGMTLLRSLRRRGYAQPILIITARHEVFDRVAGLDAGADDFVIKPFDLEELGARVRAAVRRGAGRASDEIVHGDIVIDRSRRVVRQRGRVVSLTTREFALLLALLARPGQVLTRANLEEALYGWGSEVESNAIEVHIHHLRRKLGRDLIRTVHRLGYCVRELE
ncbi:MAG: regulator [Betaproteobacteria bacterium]|jgi:two-component system response regulator QseB|nr:regulator [Betaproteobacteria bacterium]